MLQVRMTPTGAVLTDTSIGLNANGIIISCLHFLGNTKNDALIKAFGNTVWWIGAVIGGAHIALTGCVQHLWHHVFLY